MFKELVSPFHSLLQFTGSKTLKQSRPPCNCDDDDDCGMAPECAFVCNWLPHERAHKTSKKRRLNAHAAATKKTKRVSHNDN
jgi:hypothetical protein